MMYAIVTTSCTCHPETCNHFHYHVVAGEGKDKSFDTYTEAKYYIASLKGTND